ATSRTIPSQSECRLSSSPARKPCRHGRGVIILPTQDNMKFGAVAIGRNEGDGLKRCIESLSAKATAVVYVDSGSTDGSARWARSQGVDVIDLDMSVPFTAARARNAGLRRLREIAPDLACVQFVDGDCELNERWPKQALSFLDAHDDVGAVCG